MTYESPLPTSIASWYTSNHSVGLIDPPYLSIANGLKFGGQETFYRMRETGLIPPESRVLVGELY
jgi:hypothetical protein